MKNIYGLLIVIITLFSCTNPTSEISEPVIIGSVKNDDGNVKSLTVGDVSNEQIWLDYIKAHNEKNLDKIAEINGENWEGYTADGSVVKGSDNHIEILRNWFESSSPRWEVKWMIANAGENEQGEIEQWLTTGNDYYDVDAEGNEIFQYNVHDVQFKDGKIVKINVYSREKEVESKEFSY